MSALSFLLLDAPPARPAPYHRGWARGFAQHPWVAARSLDLPSTTPQDLERASAQADIILLMPALAEGHLDLLEKIAPALDARRGGLVAFTGHDVNHPAVSMARKRAAFQALGVNWAVTQLTPEAGRWLYGECAGRVISLPHGVSMEDFPDPPGWDARPYDLGAAYDLGRDWLGEQTAKNLMAHARGLAREPALGISFHETLLPLDQWRQFLRDCRMVMGMEGGSWYLDPDDAALRAIDALRNPTRSGLERLLAAVGFKRRARDKKYHDPNALEDDETYDAPSMVFSRRAGCVFYSKYASARHFEAMAAGSLQILVRGRYCDMLTEGLHYLPIHADGGDLAQALDAAMDPAVRHRILTAAFEAARDQHDYRHRVTALISALAQSEQSAA